MITESITTTQNAVLLRDGTRAILGKQKNHKIRVYRGKFIEPPREDISASKYSFKPGTNCLDITVDPGLNAELFEKVGYVFFKLDLKRLYQSSVAVQERLLVDLLSHNYWASQTTHLKYAVKDMPGYTKKPIDYYILLEKQTGRIAGAVFTKTRPDNRIQIRSLMMGQRFQNQGLGGLLLTTAIRRMQQSAGATFFYLNASKESATWYPKYGFQRDQASSSVRDFTLSLRNKSQRACFYAKEQAAIRGLSKPTFLQLIARTFHMIKGTILHFLT